MSIWSEIRLLTWRERLFGVYVVFSLFAVLAAGWAFISQLWGGWGTLLALLTFPALSFWLPLDGPQSRFETLVTRRLPERRLKVEAETEADPEASTAPPDVPKLTPISSSRLTKD